MPHQREDEDESHLEEGETAVLLSPHPAVPAEVLDPDSGVGDWLCARSSLELFAAAGHASQASQPRAGH